MSLDRWYRLVHHATLGLAGVCLVVGEGDFIPGCAWLLVPYLGLLAVAAWVEGRWVLPITGANVLGVAIIGFVCWKVADLRSSDLVASDMPLVTMIVPYVGPLLMALLAVQAFRPRTRGNFWLLHGLGLLLVALGCVLAVGPLFSGLVAIYLAAIPACLVLHYLHRERVGVSSSPPAPLDSDREMPRLRPRLSFAFFLTPFALRWLLGAGTVGLALFLSLPRGEGQTWDPRANFGTRYFEPLAKAQTGFGDSIDLRRTGTVEVNEDEAFTVTAVAADGQTPADLPADQRWRGSVLERYHAGIWKGHPHNSLMVSSHGRLAPVGPGQRLLTLTVHPRKAGGLFLADPIISDPWALTDVALLTDPIERPALPFDALTGTVSWPLVNRFFPNRREFKYRQVAGPSNGQDRRFARELSPDYSSWLLVCDVPSLPEWTTGLVRRLAAQRRYGLAEEDGLIIPVPQNRWEAVAHALNEYLARSGDYAYTLDLRRDDASLDPVLDFLKNVKTGHCERYATALALMLRSQGIPARIVKGFRGAEQQEDGVYVVRQSHAHSWVEALVLDQDVLRFDWLTLDPTPADDAPVQSRFSLAKWWEESRRTLVGLWQVLVLDYNAEQQYEASQFLLRLLRGLWKGPALWLLAFLGAGLLLWQGPRLLRMARHRRERVAGKRKIVVAFYARLLGLLEKHFQLRPQPTQTPREFAVHARQTLLSHSATASLADLPGRVAGLFYRVRFGDRPLSESEARDLANQLDRLAAAFS
jgi:protein-glutamine gamma-glutamyltransferase